jgi:hypothetical protein
MKRSSEGSEEGVLAAAAPARTTDSPAKSPRPPTKRSKSRKEMTVAASIITEDGDNDVVAEGGSRIKAQNGDHRGEGQQQQKKAKKKKKKSKSKGSDLSKSTTDLCRATNGGSSSLSSISAIGGASSDDIISVPADKTATAPRKKSKKAVRGVIARVHSEAALKGTADRMRIFESSLFQSSDGVGTERLGSARSSGRGTPPSSAKRSHQESAPPPVLAQQKEKEDDLRRPARAVTTPLRMEDSSQGWGEESSGGLGPPEESVSRQPSRDDVIDAAPDEHRCIEVLTPLTREKEHLGAMRLRSSSSCRPWPRCSVC